MQKSTILNGNGTIEAMQYAGGGYLFGFSPASIVPEGSIISQNNWMKTVSKNWNEPLNWLNECTGRKLKYLYFGIFI